jgi:hypothetical protein
MNNMYRQRHEMESKDYYSGTLQCPSVEELKHGKAQIHPTAPRSFVLGNPFSLACEPPEVRRDARIEAGIRSESLQMTMSLGHYSLLVERIRVDECIHEIPEGE